MDPDRNDTVLILEDFHPFLDIDRQPELISMLRSIYKRSVVGSGSNTLILLQPEMKIPSELEKEIQVLELPLPEEEEIRTLVKSVIDTFNIGPRDYDDNKRLIDAALGLTTGEVLSAFSCAAVKRKRLTVEEVPLIVAEKKQVISKRGNLEYYEPEQMMTDIGGLDNLKDWLDRRNKAFSQEAADFGLDAPRGIMLLGLPGTGKSLAAKAVANTWQMPLLRLDMGRIFGGIVGQSESNMRAALNIAETIAPCVLWIDEIEKGMSGMQSSGATDGGTTSRVLGTFLTWMQEKKKPVFVVATANNISPLPPELLRKGRVDEIFFVDLPTKKERCEIINIHLNKRNRSLPENDVETIAEKSLGYTGAEIEEAIKDAMSSIPAIIPEIFLSSTYSRSTIALVNSPAFTRSSAASMSSAFASSILSLLSSRASAIALSALFLASLSKADSLIAADLASMICFVISFDMIFPVHVILISTYKDTVG